MSTLTQLFTSIANSIRGKDGTTATIPAENFPTRIAAIPTGELTEQEYTEANNDVDDILENTTVPSGTITITENGTYDVTNYIGASVSIPFFPPNWTAVGYSTTPPIIITDYNYSKDVYDNWDSSQTSMSQKYYNNTDLVYMPLVDTSHVTNMDNAFNGCSNLMYLPLLDTSNVTSMNSAFRGCSKLTSVPLLDTGKVTNMNCLFYNDSITEIPQLDTKNVTIFWGMCYYCRQLVTVPVLNTSKATTMESMFENCQSLSNDSLNNILTMCTNATSYAGTKTLRFLGLKSAQATTCTGLSNWAAAQSAGWATGY